MTTIQVKLNPDTPPTGTDLSIVNAARRSFNTRSDWDTLSHSEMTRKLDTENLANWTWVASGNTGYYYKLKDKDKRLIEFLVRGMTANDFEAFLQSTEPKSLTSVVEQAQRDTGDVVGFSEIDVLVDKLWQWRNTPTHDTPFNHTFISFEVKAPIFVARQLFKSEYLIASEFSRRYITDGIEFYEPDYWRKAAPNKKQGSLEEAVEIPVFDEYWVEYQGGLLVDTVAQYNQFTQEYFTTLLKAGVAPEQARMVLPQSTMTEWTWSGTLGAFAKMCQLRLHPEAQYEARLVAQEVYKYLKEQWPVAAPALVEGVR
jgi:thymidylate synthase (FAD)